MSRRSARLGLPRLVPRERPRAALEAVALAVALAGAAGAGAVLFAACGADPVGALATLVTEPFGSLYGLSETLVKTVPLGFCALAVALALRIDLWNIGAEGQLFMGAFGASLVALHLPLPGGLALPACVLAAALAGAAWAAVPGLLKVTLRVNEILSTLMLNYVAIAWVEFLVYGPWKGADGFPYTAFFPDATHLPLLFKRVHLGIGLLVLAAVGLHALLRWTPLGFEIRVTGASRSTARYVGLPVLPRLLLVMGLAGAMAGIAGAMEVLGVEHRLHAGISAGYGYTAIIVAFLARTHLLAALVVAFGMAALAVGGDGVQMAFPGVSSAVVEVFQGLLLLGVLVGSTFSRYRVAWGVPTAARPGGETP